MKVIQVIFSIQIKFVMKSHIDQFYFYFIKVNNI